ncbi:unnamed protein product [Mytilus edulis]|uniref:Uncharacterized protein n=1 Tax=Mytilus edulis TaxID=6550 RepID=A0A8S3UT95_MYTED|nr:unnamed protein product [Mytilus edulis]
MNPHLSIALYRYLCRNIVGTEDQVKRIRHMNAVRDNIESRNGVRVITSGSFGEGLEMRGSDIDRMKVLPFSVSEDLIHHLNPSKLSLIMEREDVKPCYTLLRLESINNQKFFNLCEVYNGSYYLSSALYQQYYAAGEDITSFATSPVKIIIKGLDENELKAALLNSIADQLTDDNIQFIKARKGSLILHVRIRTTLLKELKVLFEHLTSFLECVLCIACDESDVRENSILLCPMMMLHTRCTQEKNFIISDEIESSKSDETTEIFLDSNGQSALILDVEVNDRILQSSKRLGKVVKEFIGKVITKTHGKEVIREKKYQ